MNIKRIVAFGLATAWLLVAHSSSDGDGYVIGIIASNIWMAAWLLLPREDKE